MITNRLFSRLHHVSIYWIVLNLYIYNYGGNMDYNSKLEKINIIFKQIYFDFIKK